MAFWQANAPLQKSGQTTDRSVAGRTCKDDGNTQYGIDHQFEALTLGQFSGTTGITVNAKTDTHTNNCVKCKSSGLMWNKDRAASVGPASNGLIYWDDTGGSDEDIFEYCDQANLAGLSGFSDWRVPNWLELNSLLLLEATLGAPYLNTTFFPNVGAAIVWSSTTAANNVNNGVVINYNAGIPTVSPKTTGANSCMLVRGQI